VVRYCTVTGTTKIDGHGLASNTPPRGVRQMEVYGNRWTAVSNFWQAIEIRGGTGMVFDNTAAGTATGAWFYLTDYGYLGVWANFNSTYQTPGNYPIKDQIGVGMDPKASGSEPYYVWNNVQSGAPWVRSIKTPAAGAITLHGSIFTERDMVQANRDFFASSGFDGTYTFDGTQGMGRGTKAEMQAIVPTKNKVGFWVTDEGTWNRTFVGVQSAPAIEVGDVCEIVEVGDTDFTAIGAGSNTAGVTFKASGPGTGTGTVKPAQGRLYTWNGAAWVLKYEPFPYPHPMRLPGTPVATLE
jgi:hypothetical protein